MSAFLKLFIRAIEISRPIFWPTTFLCYLLGIGFSGAIFSPVSFFLAFLWAFPYSLWGAALNDLSDTETDQRNQFKGGISGSKIQVKEQPYLQALASIGALVVVLPNLGINSNLPSLLCGAIALGLPYLYSVPPLRLKVHPPLDSLSNGLCLSSIFLSGYFLSSSKPLSAPAQAMALGILLAVSAVHIIGALRDYTPDKESGTTTIAVVLGQRLAALLASSLFVLCFLIAQAFPLEIQLSCLYAAVSSLYLVVYPSEKRSLHLGLSMIMVFCLALIFTLSP